MELLNIISTICGITIVCSWIGACIADKRIEANKRRYDAHLKALRAQQCTDSGICEVQWKPIKR